MRLTSTPEILAAVPYLLGFHPADSVVVVAVQDHKLLFGLRHDLPGGDPPGVAALVAQHGAEQAMVIGYGARSPVVPATGAALRLAGVHVLDVVRVDGGQFWSYLRDDPGRPIDPSTTVVAAEATFQGLVVLPGRDALVAQFAQVTGAERAAMTAATTRAEARFAEWEAREPSEARFARSMRRAGFAAVRAAENRATSGRRMRDDEVAWLGVLLADPVVCEYAWRRAEAGDVDQVLWTDVVRRVDRAYVPAPATLLGFTAWRRGFGPAARAALDRALDADPHFEPALLLDEVLTRGLSPAAVADWPGRSRPPRTSAARRRRRNRGRAA